MKAIKTSIAVLVGAALLSGCNDDTEYVNVQPKEVKIATYNLSFDRATFETLVDEMQIEPTQQAALVTSYLDGSIAAEDKTTAEKVIQIRNVAAIIQKNRPDVLMMAEYNNDGTGENKAAIEGFQKNYLSVAQSIDGAGGEANLEPIEYPYAESYSTNTGLLSEFDLDNNGTAGQMPGDAWGFGMYHGQYAFALMSKYKIDTANTRTFQAFKWKDMEGAKIPTITICDGSQKIPDGMKCGDEWYSAEEWDQVRLSSKNHVDAPIIIPTRNGEEVVHLLMSHPTPPVFDTGKNKAQNATEVEFWHHYIQGKDYFYDDAGKTGGLTNGAKFVMMGDQNLDPVSGDGISSVMQELHNDPLVNQTVMNGELYPTSFGAAEHAVDRSSTHPYPNRITSTFGLGVDYALPSANLNVIDSGVYWSASYEEGHKLFNDARIGKYGDGKDVSSDHRMIWIKAQF
ncbi:MULTISPECIES: endonuclease/exonuclease/phosphatase family protein [Vibrio]|uniref:endonuclease/exonuclease/phosphatase family protein n=1 Tax=Vibrio TaxID=662 RepID=UPI00215D25C3|nr:MULTISPECIES: endonuclease/exonuclease/phosphatase family protein [Vibrio]MCR9335424.1 endonuclease/exonuclease/phosphatase family protein [Vibrio alginolyticus]MCR9342792.1 endonuclease/exonuclease/phosphatase family protein [Vibrio alginolyticus]MDY8147139.1 endonuclease/exonuclease/phosphatase family protein [Vibrio sp. PBL-C16]